MKQNFEYGKYSYDYFIEYSNRKTFGLMIRPDLRIIAKVPTGATVIEIEAFLKRKWLWLQKQIDEFKKYQKKIYKKEYVSGESFQYLGRQYMLYIERASQDCVKLVNNRLVIYSTKDVQNSKYNQILLDSWFDRRRNAVFKQEYMKALKLFSYNKMPQLRVRIMARRWGSYTQDNKISLNPNLIKAPKEAINYVITHELCHLNNKKHDELFYKELEKRIPNWREIKERLEIRYG